MMQHVTCAPTLPPTPAGIDYLTGTKVTAVDVAAKQLTTAGGEAITYDKLVVATGARVRKGTGGWMPRPRAWVRLGAGLS